MTTARVAVYVQPRASKTEVAGMHAGSIKIRLAAPPVDGAANEALRDFIADTLGLPKRSVRIISGETSRRKIVEVEGMTAATIAKLLGGGGVPAVDDDPRKPGRRKLGPR